MRYAIFIFILIYSFNSYSQTISGVVNSYTSVVSIDPCDHNKLEVTSTTGFSIGDKVMIIQMQGLSINETNTASFGTFNALADTSTGYYESAVISNISGNVFSFNNDILNRYNPSKNLQIVNIPQYTNVTVSGVLTPQAWNGTTGGVLAIEVSGTLTLSANISAQGRGFRGGKRLAAIANSCNFLTSITDYATDTLTWQYKSFKGEGVATYVANKWGSRGPQANGGGGGNDHNAGGGGGANKANGGLGGRNNEPGSFNCKGYQPGLGGLSLASLTGDRVFMGGGGGSGHENNNVNFAGGNGGGIIYIKAASIVSSGNIITASGDSSLRGGGDGGSGGGGGGTIILDVLSFTGNLTVSANGGKGATTDNGNAARCFGPGGGGSGGVIKFTAASVRDYLTLQTLGGAPGVVYRSTNACNNTSNSATAGLAGSSTLATSGVPASFKSATTCNPLPVTWLYFNVNSQNTFSILKWATASEINNDYFEILRSNDGINYFKIGEIKGKGNTTQTSYYEFIDTKPLNGVNYYKLKQVDTDKKYDFSKIEYIYNGLNWTHDDILIYPNPIEMDASNVNVVFPSTTQQINLYYYDLVGNLLYMEKLSDEDAYNGNHSISINNKIIGNTIVVKLVAASGEIYTKKIVRY